MKNDITVTHVVDTKNRTFRVYLKYRKETCDFLAIKQELKESGWRNLAPFWTISASSINVAETGAKETAGKMKLSENAGERMATAVSGILKAVDIAKKRNH